MKISKNKKNVFFLSSQGSLDPKIRFLGQKVWSIARVRTDRHTRKWILRAPFQGFRIFSFNLSSRIGPIYGSVSANWSVQAFRQRTTMSRSKSSINTRMSLDLHEHCKIPKIFNPNTEPEGLGNPPIRNKVYEIPNFPMCSWNTDFSMV